MQLQVSVFGQLIVVFGGLKFVSDLFIGVPIEQTKRLKSSLKRNQTLDTVSNYSLIEKNVYG